MIADADVRGMIQLLGDVAALDGGHPEKKRFLMDGLSVLVGADAWAWTLACRIEPTGPQTYAGFLHGGFSEEKFTKFVEALEHPNMIPATELFFSTVVQSSTQVTMLREEVNPNEVALKSDVSELWKEADIGPLIMSTCPFDDGSQSTIGLYRRYGSEPFDQREKHIAHLILSEVRWLHMLGWPEDRGATVPQLYPRQRMVLNCLLDGMGRKQIADRLQISENTVSSYAKEVYRHFQVNSHVELMRKFLHANHSHGDGNRLGDR